MTEFIKNGPEILSADEMREKFRQEIADIRELEMRNKDLGGEYNPHFEKIDANNLGGDDLDIYAKLKNGSLTQAEFADYRNGFSENDRGESRKMFMYWLANQLSVGEWLKKWQAESFKKEE